ncbi:MAG: histidine phosphatase family protein [Gammaproteobacteria bacterium]
MAFASLPARVQRSIAWTMMGLLSLVFALPAAADQGAWDALPGGGHVALIRHANAPGMGDPSHFDVDDCATQRNLDPTGRDQARAIGDLFRSHGIAFAEVHSSRWCRCLETARLMDLGPVSEQPVLNSFFQDFAQREPQTRALGEWLADHPLRKPLILVTHQVNITAFSGVYPESGEIVIMRREADGGFSVVGTIPTL